jgi:hypothetical protein
LKKRRNQCHAYKGKKANDLRTKEGNSFKSSIFRVEVVISAKHISSAPTGESSSTVELQIGRAATPEWVWWSRSPAKHALKAPRSHPRPRSRGRIFPRPRPRAGIMYTTGTPTPTNPQERKHSPRLPIPAKVSTCKYK